MSQKVITLEKNGDNFDVVIPSRSLREFTSVFLMILKQLRFSLLTIKSYLEVNTLVSIPVC